MPSLANHQSNEFSKCLFIGDSKAGKTGALTSLVKAGYKLRILDYDNGLDVLKEFVLHECPDMIANIEFRTLQDKRKAEGGQSVVSDPKAYSEGIKMLDAWKYTFKDGASGVAEVIDYGKPYTWGPDCILVLDSLSRFSDAAFDYYGPLTPNWGTTRYDPRQTYKTAQDAVIECLATLTGDNFKTNVIVIAHVRYMDMIDGTKKGFPQSVGSAVCSQIPQYFNSYALFENEGGARKLKTVSTPLIDLANPKPFAMAKSYPISTGLAEFFAVLRQPPKQEAPKKVARRA